MTDEELDGRVKYLNELCDNKKYAETRIVECSKSVEKLDKRLRSDILEREFPILFEEAQKQQKIYLNLVIKFEEYIKSFTEIEEEELCNLEVESKRRKEKAEREKKEKAARIEAKKKKKKEAARIKAERKKKEEAARIEAEKEKEKERYVMQCYKFIRNNEDILYEINPDKDSPMSEKCVGIAFRYVYSECSLGMDDDKIIENAHMVNLCLIHIKGDCKCGVDLDPENNFDKNYFINDNSIVDCNDYDSSGNYCGDDYDDEGNPKEERCECHRRYGTAISLQVLTYDNWYKFRYDTQKCPNTKTSLK